VVGDEPWTEDPRVTEWAVDMVRRCVACLEGTETSMDAEDQPPYNPPFHLTRDKGKDMAALDPPPAKGKGKTTKGSAKGESNGSAKGGC